MRRVLVLLLMLLLAACSKQEPPPATNVGGSLPPDKNTRSEHKASLTPDTREPAPSTSATAPDGLPSEALAKEGEQLFSQNCATCHMADGGGVPYLQPSIQGSAWLSNPDPQLLLTLILRGSGVLGEAAQAYENDMAPHTFLTDAEIAALATHARRRFAVPPVTEPVTPAQVAVARARPGLPP